jgi:ribonuclease P protein subunit RPR2
MHGCPVATDRVRVLIVDDDGAERWLLRRRLELRGGIEVVGEAQGASDAIVLTQGLRPDVVLMDIQMPGADGVEATRRLARLVPGTRVLVLSGHDDAQTVRSAIRAGASGYVVKGDDFDGIVRAVLDVHSGATVLSARATPGVLADVSAGPSHERASADESVSHMRAVAHALSSAMEARDACTSGHSSRVADLGMAILRHMDPAEAEDPYVEFAFLLHDVGKIAVADSILFKPGPLTDDEWQQMRQHPLAGAQILERCPTLRGSDLVRIVRHHHERWDGRGYPDGLAGPDIPVACRAFAVADTFDAITSDRPYRPADSTIAAHDEVCRHRGTQFDPAAVDALTALVLGL